MLDLTAPKRVLSGGKNVLFIVPFQQWKHGCTVVFRLTVLRILLPALFDELALHSHHPGGLGEDSSELQLEKQAMISHTPR